MANAGLGGGFSPNQLTNLQLWSRSDFVSASPVSNWPNIGLLGGSFDGAGGARPTWSAADANWNGQPSITWDDVDDQLVSTLAAAAWTFLHNGAGSTLVVVARPTATGTLIDTNNMGATNNGIAIDWNFNSANESFWSVANGSGVLLIGDGAPLAGSAKGVMVARMATAESPQYSLRMNGVSGGSGAFVGAAAAGAATFTMRLGGVSAGIPYGGSMVEIMAFDRYLTLSEVVQIESYAMARYAI